MSFRICGIFKNKNDNGADASTIEKFETVTYDTMNKHDGNDNDLTGDT